MTDFLFLLLAWAVGLVTGLVLRIGREKQAELRGIAIGKRKMWQADIKDRDEQWRELLR